MSKPLRDALEDVMAAMEKAWQAAHLARYDGVQSLIHAAQQKLADALAAPAPPCPRKEEGVCVCRFCGRDASPEVLIHGIDNIRHALGVPVPPSAEPAEPEPPNYVCPLCGGTKWSGGTDWYPRPWCTGKHQSSAGCKGMQPGWPGDTSACIHGVPPKTWCQNCQSRGPITPERTAAVGP